MDSADDSVGRQFLENVQAALNGRSLDYLIVNHMEPDHCAMIDELVLRYPDMQIIGNAKTFPMIDQFFNFDLDGKKVIVNRRRYFLYRQTYTSLCHGSDGTLAGSYDDIR